MTREELNTLKKGDMLTLDSSNGQTYKIRIESINSCREPQTKFACDMWDGNGVSYYNAFGDFAFVGDDFILQCEKMKEE